MGPAGKLLDCMLKIVLHRGWEFGALHRSIDGVIWIRGFAMQGDAEKEAFIQQLAQPISSFPHSVCVCRILPLLIQELKPSNKVAAGGPEQGASRWKIMALSPLARIAPHIDAAQFKAEVIIVLILPSRVLYFIRRCADGCGVRSSPSSCSFLRARTG